MHKKETDKVHMLTIKYNLTQSKVSNLVPSPAYLLKIHYKSEAQSQEPLSSTLITKDHPASPVQCHM